MWKYIKKYLLFGILAAVFMVGEVMMDLLQPELMSQIVDDGVLGLNSSGVTNMEMIWKLGIKMICLVLFGAFCGSMNNAFVHMSGQNVGNEIRKDAFSKLMTFSFSQVDYFKTGSLVTRMTNDITQVQNFVSQFVRGMIRTGMLMFGSIFFIFKLNKDYGIVVLCAFPFILGCMIFCLLKANPLFIKLQAQLDKINTIMQEDITGIRTIKAFVKETYEKLRFKKVNENLVKTQLKVLIILAFMNPIINALMYMVVAIILKVGSVDVFYGATTPGDIMAAITYTTQLLNGIMGLTMLFQNISRGFASWNRIKEILDTCPELKDGLFAGDTKIKGQIEFRDVSFSYPSSNQLVLKNISFKIKPGEVIAIMGATGCGKSTLVNLIPRFYDCSQGAILIDDVDVKEYNLFALRKKIAIALQKAELFHESIKENIAWGYNKANEDDIKEVAKIAQADDFISKMPDGYDSLVAQRGTSLSGGQKQRVSIARTLLKNSEIIILDDATSALDLKTEASFYTALKIKRKDTTIVMTAQRIASVVNVDRIIVLDKEEIIAIGNHKELLNNCKVYRDIYDSQMGGNRNE